MGIGTSITAVVIGRMGTNFVAANSIYTVINQLVSVMIFGVGNAALTVVGNTIGAGEYEKAKQRSVTLLALSVVLGLFSAAVTLALGPVVISFYNFSEATISIAGGSPAWARSSSSSSRSRSPAWWTSCARAGTPSSCSSARRRSCGGWRCRSAS